MMRSFFTPVTYRLRPAAQTIARAPFAFLPPLTMR